MIEIEEAAACIVNEVFYNYKEKTKQEIIAFYDDDQCCYGEFDITDLEIYEMKNPYFLADTFIFCKKHYDNVFLVGECDLILYIKINNCLRIEEIGNDFANRFHFDNFDELIQRKDVQKAEPIHRLLFSLIDDDFWLKNIIEKSLKNIVEKPKRHENK